MEENRNQIHHRTRRLLGWWRKLISGSRVTPSAPPSMGEDARKKQLNGESVAPSYCKHTRVVRTVWRSVASIVSRKTRRQLVVDCCPICGLPAKKDRWMEYVLRVWFIDDDAYEYFFRGRRERECFQISDSVLKVFLKGSVVCYPLHMISSMEFTARKIPPDSPEVLEAERILKSKSNLN